MLVYASVVDMRSCRETHVDIFDVSSLRVTGDRCFVKHNTLMGVNDCKISNFATRFSPLQYRTADLDTTCWLLHTMTRPSFCQHPLYRHINATKFTSPHLRMLNRDNERWHCGYPIVHEQTLDVLLRFVLLCPILSVRW